MLMLSLNIRTERQALRLFPELACFTLGQAIKQGKRSVLESGKTVMLQADACSRDPVSLLDLTSAMLCRWPRVPAVHPHPYRRSIFVFELVVVIRPLLYVSLRCPLGYVRYSAQPNCHGAQFLCSPAIVVPPIMCCILSIMWDWA